MSKRKKSTNNKNHYVDKDSLVNEVKFCQEQNQVSEKLAEMFIKIVEGVVLRFPNVKYFGIEEDAKQDCLLLLCRKYNNFNTSLGTSCFAYMTTLIYNQLRYQVSKARKHRDRQVTMTKRVREYFSEHIDESENLFQDDI